MKTQNFENHAQFVKGYHFVLGIMLLAGLAISSINLYRHMHDNRLAVSLLLPFIFVCLLLMSYYIRVFPLKAQDRAIRAEESLRYFILSGKAFDKRITTGQIIALRFAPDEELLELADRAVSESLSPKQIKAAVRSWRADHDRV